MRGRRMIGVAVLLALMLSGCWDRIEVNDLGIVTQVGVDKAEAGVRLTVGVVVPARGQGGGPQVGGRSENQGSAATYSAEGTSIANAIARVQEKVSRRLFWAHARVLVIGEDLARDSVLPVLDFWTRHRQPRLLLKVVVTPGEAADFLEAQPRLERLLSEAVRETINLRLQTRTTLKDFVDDLRSEVSQPVAPRAEVVPGSARGQDVQVSGTALFRGPQLVGWLDDQQTRGLMWLRNEMETGTVTLMAPDGGSVGMQAVRGNTVVRPVVVGGRLTMSVQVNAEFEVIEATVPLDLSKRDAVEAVQKQLERSLAERMQSTLAVVQKKNQVDAVKFGDAVRRHMPPLWEGGLKRRWEEVFPTVPVRIAVTAEVRRAGEHGAPLGFPSSEVKPEPPAGMNGGE